MVTVVNVDAGPTTVARRVEVAASAAEIFAFIANPRQLHKLDVSGTMREVPVLGPDRLSVGDSFTVGVQKAGIPYQATSTVTSLEDDRFIEWEDAYGRKWRWELAETSAGTTEVTESMDFGAAVTPLFDQMTGDNDNHATAITQSLHQLASRFAHHRGPNATRPEVCYARWSSPNLKAAS